MVKHSNLLVKSATNSILLFSFLALLFNSSTDKRKIESNSPPRVAVAANLLSKGATKPIFILILSGFVVLVLAHIPEEERLVKH